MTKTDELIERLRGARARFGLPGFHHAEGEPHSQFVFDVLGEAIEALRASPAPLQAQTSVPAGYRVVPEEPTEAMLKRGYDAFMAAHDPFFNKNEPVGPIYKAMIAAAASPAPASAQVTEEADYTIHLQRIIEALCHGTPLREDSKHLWHHKMAQEYRAALHPGREERE